MSIFDIVVLILLIWTGYNGYKRGVIEEALRLAGMLFATLAAVNYYDTGAGYIQQLGIGSQGVATILGFVAVFLATWVLFRMANFVFDRLVNLFHLSWLDKSLGLLFGAMKGLVLLLVFVWIVSVVFDKTDFEKRFRTNSRSYPVLVEIKQFAIHQFGLTDELFNLQDQLRKMLKLDAPKIEA